MRKRFVLGTLAALCMLVLPVLFSPSSGESLMNSAPFATVAIAGHITSSGVYCDCNGQCGGSNLTISPSAQGDDQNSDDSATYDFNAGTFALLFLAMLYLRVRV